MAPKRPQRYLRGEQPHALVSLREIMKSYFGDLVVIAARLARAYVILEMRPAADAPPELVRDKDANDWEQIRIVGETIPVIAHYARELNLPLVVDQCERLQGWLDQTKDRVDPKIESGVFEVLSRLSDSLKAVHFMHVPPHHAAIYQDGHPLGREFSEKFPSSIFDSREAAKCLGLGLPTAAVLHLMRVIDGCISKGLNPRLFITAKTWKGYVDGIRQAVNTKRKLKRVNWT